MLLKQNATFFSLKEKRLHLICDKVFFDLSFQNINFQNPNHHQEFLLHAHLLALASQLV